MNTPWGNSQIKETIVPGMVWVSTASHGGIMITETCFNQHGFRDAARQRAQQYGTYLCYEEDCQISVIMMESYLRAFTVVWKRLQVVFEGLKVKSLMNSLYRWNPDYMIEVGITPIPDDKR